MKSVSIALFAGIIGCAFVQPVPAAEAATYNENVLYSFCSQPDCTDGQWPDAGLIDAQGTLYGTTVFGGASGSGSVFAVNADTGSETVLYSFTGGTDGALPEASLIDVKGTLYGTTSQGGQSGEGTVFSVDPNTGVETVLHSFGGGSDGAYVLAGVISVKGILYGTTFDGGTGCGTGSGGCGIVFSVDPATGAETVLHTFGISAYDGEWPDAGVIALKSKLYGTTREGGYYGDGTIFSLDLRTGDEKALYSFCPQSGCPDGAWPQAGLVEVNGVLYGTTVYGGGSGCRNGPPGCGTVFAFDPDTNAENVLYAFGAATAHPGAMIGMKGTLYGTTSTGVIFSIDTATDAEKVLYSFGSSAGPSGVIDVKHVLYGTTMMGGGNDGGTVFALERTR